MDAIDKQPPGRSALSRDVRPTARRAVLEDLSLVNPALIAAYPLRNGQVLPPLADPTSASTEQYRTIKVQIEHLNRAGASPIRTIVMTSPCPGDGKTLTALNLALVLAQDEGKTVLMIDADLHKPGLGDLFAHRPKLGLIDLLAREARLTQVLFRPEGSCLLILPSGSETVTPAELLGSTSMKSLLADFVKRFNYVIIDTPPVVPFVDADVVSILADASLLVVRSRWTPRRLVAQAVETMSKHRLLGVIMNDVRSTPFDRYYYRYDKHYYRGGKR